MRLGSRRVKNNVWYIRDNQGGVLLPKLLCEPKIGNGKKYTDV